MSRLAVIGGTGLVKMEGLVIRDDISLDTPFGKPSSCLYQGSYAGREIVFLPRHGDPPVIPPHRVNYRANLWALKETGVKTILGINAVGGISAPMIPCRLVVPHQIIDYTWGRKHTFFENETTSPVHVDFTHPYSESLRGLIIAAASRAEVSIHPHGIYAATQGPRLETAAEIMRLERDGCDIVGMTGMPETALARELELEYAAIALVVNLAAGKGTDQITMDLIRENMDKALADLMRLFNELIPEI